MRDKLLSLPRYQKHLLILAVDTLSIWLALTLAFSVRLGWGDFYQNLRKASPNAGGDISNKPVEGLQNRKS
ncbi:hypothetical protein [Endozoicomonas sp. YOMI1]|uniref:hypothetical protein n=1 Tax=Endozoicomonas sp. YOMI1 TaxID=2828739 RepID=UPI0021472882|nr:hypothetical protein [Endozoicomonas sp. YOMI1]